MLPLRRRRLSEPRVVVVVAVSLRLLMLQRLPRKRSSARLLLESPMAPRLRVNRHTLKRPSHHTGKLR